MALAARAIGHSDSEMVTLDQGKRVMTEILLVEDDPALGRGLSVNLEHEGFKVHWVQDLRSAFKANEEKKLDLVILDLGLPDGSGLTLLREMRKAGSRLPVLVLTAKTDEDSVVEGLQSGANDYVRKPFSDRELMARVRIALREPQTRSEQLRYCGLIILFDRRQVLYEGREIPFTPKEFDAFTFLVQHAEAVVSREMLLQAIDKDNSLFDRTVDSHVSHIRTRLRLAGVDTIHIGSIYGIGYRLEPK